MQKRKLILIAVIAVIFGLIGWQIIQKVIQSSHGSDIDRGAMAVAVEVEAVKKSMIRDFGNFAGSLVPKSQYMLAPKISGRLEKLMVNIGDWIERDQLIAVLDDEEYSQQVRQAEADLQVAKANLEESKSSLDVAKRESERVQELHKKGISADSELDSVKGAYSTSEARYKVAQAQVSYRQTSLEAAKTRLSYTKIRATWEKGANLRVVGERLVDEGTMLTPNAPILSILEINPLIAVIHITDKDYFRVTRGKTAIISSDALPGKTISGEILRIAPQLKETSREARIEIEIPNSDGLLKPGMFINVQIEFEILNDATVVPVSSIVKRDNQQGVFLVDAEKKIAKFVPVKVGISNNELAEIIDPASLSGFVVTLGQHLLAHGSPVILPQPSSPQENTDSNKVKPGEKR